MAKQLDNSFVALSRPASMYPHVLLGGGVAILLLVGLGLAISTSTWPLVAVFALSLVGLSAYSWISFDKLRTLSAIENQKHIAWESALPDIQRENLNVEVLELSRILDVDLDQVSDLQSAYIVAEDLALRQIQQEDNVPLIRHVSIGGIPFDAVLLKEGLLICCDVSFLVAPDVRQEKVDAMMRKIASVKQVVEAMKLGLTVKLMMIIITQLTPEDEDYLRRTLDTKRFSSTPVDIDIRLLDFEALQRIYVTD